VVFEGHLIGDSGIGLDDILISSSTKCILMPASASMPSVEKSSNGKALKCQIMLVKIEKEIVLSSIS
jgi:hypothetical protein